MGLHMPPPEEIDPFTPEEEVEVQKHLDQIVETLKTQDRFHTTWSGPRKILKKIAEVASESGYVVDLKPSRITIRKP